jgi:hypothetical protein
MNSPRSTFEKLRVPICRSNEVAAGPPCPSLQTLPSRGRLLDVLAVHGLLLPALLIVEGVTEVCLAAVEGIAPKGSPSKPTAVHAHAAA